MSKPVRIVTVCVPATIPVDQLASYATNAVSNTIDGANRPSPVGHFLTTARMFGGRLLNKFGNNTAGGPLRLLDLTVMQHQGRHHNWHLHQLWQQVVAGTKPAQPFWTFLDKHRAHPTTYTLAQAQQHYASQPRVLAMTTYNMLPNRIMMLPTSHLEAVQTGQDCYTQLGGLTAIPAHAMITLRRQHLAPASERMADLQDYLRDTQVALAQLSSKDQLVAVAHS